MKAAKGVSEVKMGMGMAAVAATMRAVVASTATRMLAVEQMVNL